MEAASALDDSHMLRSRAGARDVTNQLAGSPRPYPMPLHIPPRHRKALARLYELTAGDASAIVDLLSGLPAFLSTPELASKLAEIWPELREDESRRLALALLSISTQSLHWSAEDVGAMISESEHLNIPDEGRESFGVALSQMIATPVLQTSAKAVSILNRQERLFYDARIMSDIRPVFGDDPTERPAGAVLVHTLSIEHHINGEVETFNVAMDRKDLADLKETIDRALAKAATLSDVVESAGLALFELQEAER